MIKYNENVKDSSIDCKLIFKYTSYNCTQSEQKQELFTNKYPLYLVEMLKIITSQSSKVNDQIYLLVKLILPWRGVLV